MLDTRRKIKFYFEFSHFIEEVYFKMFWRTFNLKTKVDDDGQSTPGYCLMNRIYARLSTVCLEECILLL